MNLIKINSHLKTAFEISTILATRYQEIIIVVSVIGWFPTPEHQNSDSQDFHNISVWMLQEMLRASYELGKLSQETPAPNEL